MRFITLVVDNSLLSECVNDIQFLVARLLNKKLSFAPEVQASMLALQQHLFATLLTQMTPTTADNTSVDLVLDHSESLVAWCSVLAFGRWLGVDGMLLLRPSSWSYSG